MKNPDGSWAYPLVRADLATIRANGAEKLFHMEQRAIMAEDATDSLRIDLTICEVTKVEKHWYSSFEAGTVVGVALTVLAGWAIGQVGN